MSHKQDTRRTLARGRRKQDIKKYNDLLQGKVPQDLDGVVYKDQKEWDTLIAKKLKLAKSEVEVLDRVLGEEL